jgi:salicylate hydroxylase
VDVARTARPQPGAVEGGAVRVVIVGAGLGGLVLAHALQHHADVVVLERDAAAANTGGYRIALTPEAVQVMDRHVPPATMTRIRAASDGPDTFSRFTVTDRRLRPILVDREPPGVERMLCQRRVLRIVLAEGLGGRVRFGTDVVGAEPVPGGAEVRTADGTELCADLVVAADGARSTTLHGIARRPLAADLGLVGIAGSTPLRGDRLPRYLLHGPALGLSGRGTGVFLSLTSRGLAHRPPDLAEAIGPPSLVWGLIARREEIPTALREGPAALVALASEQVDGWHPWLRAQVLAADPARTAAYSFRAASPRASRFPWPSSRITAVGDAVHAMPPTGGRAGATAIRSAGALADALLVEPDVDAAVRDYQAAVDDWAEPAIRESLGPVRMIRALRSPVLRAIAGPLLDAAGAVGVAAHRGRG